MPGPVIDGFNWMETKHFALLMAVIYINPGEHLATRRARNDDLQLELLGCVRVRVTNFRRCEGINEQLPVLPKHQSARIKGQRENSICLRNNYEPVSGLALMAIRTGTTENTAL